MMFSVLGLLAVGSHTCRAESLSFDQVLQAVDRYYERLSSLKASFSQVVEVPALERQEKFHGVLYFMQPVYLRLEYIEPQGQLLVADGTWYWFYMPQPDLPQAMRAPMRQGEGAPRYVLGGNLKQRFSGQLLGREQRGGRTSYVLKLNPRKDNPYYKTLHAWVDAGTFATRAVRYVDQGGTFNTFDFFDLEPNTKFSPEIFTFTPPDGAQILDAE